jgi:hypothetical protein
MVAPRMMNNILKLSDTFNAPVTVSGYSYKVLSRAELSNIIGVTSSGISLPSLAYFATDSLFFEGFYAEDIRLYTSASGLSATVYIQRSELDRWRPYEMQQTPDYYVCSFYDVLPDRGQLFYKVRLVCANTTESGVSISRLEINTLDYPIEFDYVSFSVPASIQDTLPIAITNYSQDGLSKDLNILPAYTNNFELDRTFVVTSGSWSDHDKGWLDNNAVIPEKFNWSLGVFNNTEIYASGIRLTSGAVSGTWTSPVIEFTDPNCISLYVYGKDLSNLAVMNKDWVSVNNLVESRASDETPLPQFLVLSWNKRLWDTSSRAGFTRMPLRMNRATTISTADVPDAYDEFWNTWYPNPTITGPRPYFYGNSDRIYLKGDGTIIARNTLETREWADRVTAFDIPTKIVGSINRSWAASVFHPCLATFQPGARDNFKLDSTIHRFSSVTMADVSRWQQGTFVGNYLNALHPFAGHSGGVAYSNTGDAWQPIYWEYFATNTIPLEPFPDDWLVIIAILYKVSDWSSDKYIELYGLEMRNQWVANSKYLGAFPIGMFPSVEGYSICKKADGSGFWLHVGYGQKTIVSFDNYFEGQSRWDTPDSYSDIVETNDQSGFWAISNDAVYFLKKATDAVIMESRITSPDFQFLHSGGIDDSNNLWLTDRNSGVVFRINYVDRAIDFYQHISGSMAIWPHPTDNSAFVYLAPDVTTLSASIKRIYVGDPYKELEDICSVPSRPLGNRSLVQFTGRVSSSYFVPGKDDLNWGVTDAVTVPWQNYSIASLALPEGKFKQFRITLQRTSTAITSPSIYKIRVPLPFLLKDIPYRDSKDIFINPYLRCNTADGNFSTQLVVWWKNQ